MMANISCLDSTQQCSGVIPWGTWETIWDVGRVSNPGQQHATLAPTCFLISLLLLSCISSKHSSTVQSIYLHSWFTHDRLKQRESEWSRIPQWLTIICSAEGKLLPWKQYLCGWAEQWPLLLAAFSPAVAPQFYMPVCLSCLGLIAALECITCPVTSCLQKNSEAWLWSHGEGMSTWLRWDHERIHAHHLG